ncbi:MAG: outer membrane protein assembly factor BamD, partial [Janthinobacterium lividum]
MRFLFLSDSFFPDRRSSRISGLAIAAMLLLSPALKAQDAAAPQATPSNTAAPAAEPQSTTLPATDAATSTQAPATADATLSATPGQKAKKKHIAKDERVVQTKDTKAELRREQKYNPLVGKDASLPDKQLYDKALTEEKKGHFDVARLDLQTLLNTYPDSQYLMRAKLAVANSWFQEGGSAALAQAEQEYGDFITFFPNVPEAAEAQMRMGDIYLKQMDVPDRDYSKALKAEDQYRLMMKTYPDAPAAVHKEAEQKLRDVQEVLAQREFDLGQFYALHTNLPAAIARYQTVIDTYPLFSHMDDALIGVGDAYEADANRVRQQPICEHANQVACVPEAARAKLEQTYDGRAAAAYRSVVLNHAAAPHVEDAKERLQAMNLPLPTPTAQQVATSEALEGSRAQYTMRKRLELLVVKKPDTVNAAQLGAPPLEDAPATVAPTIVHQIETDYRVAFNPASANEASAGTPTATGPETSASEGPAEPSPAPGISTPLTLGDVPSAGRPASDSGTGSVSEATPVDTSAPAGAGVGNGGASLGAEILTPGAESSGAVTP